tara:strand:- start:11959 stop:13125 length:1167 start_codon:yes stop_codon:yes gene_type:complete
LAQTILGSVINAVKTAAGSDCEIVYEGQIEHPNSNKEKLNSILNNKMKSTLSKLFLILLIMNPVCFCYAQESNKLDYSSSIESFANKIIIKLNFDTRTNTYTILNRTDGSRFNVAPNIRNRMFVSLDYQFIGFSYGFSPSFLPDNNSDKSKGESSFSEFKTRVTLGKFIQGFSVSNTKGYYVKNRSDVPVEIPDDNDQYLIPDFKSTIYGMSTSYVFNANFSFRNLLYQTEWQKKSEGSFIPTLFYSYDRFSYTLEEQEIKNEIFPFRLALSYYYTFVVKENWFLGGNLSPSFGVNFSKRIVSINDIHINNRSTEYTKAIEGALQIGYASKKIIYGTGFSFEVNEYDVDSDNTLLNDRTYGFIYFGYRFDAPEFLDRTYSKFADKFGF